MSDIASCIELWFNFHQYKEITLDYLNSELRNFTWMKIKVQFISIQK